jgi:hypothetical protein
MFLVDVNFDKVPELFATNNVPYFGSDWSWSLDNTSWIEQGFTHADGKIVELTETDFPADFELYRDKKTGKLVWIGSIESEGISGNFEGEDGELVWTHYSSHGWWIIDFSDLASINTTTLLIWNEEYETLVDRHRGDFVDWKRKPNASTTYSYRVNEEDFKVTTKAKINNMQKNIFSRYTHIRTKQCKTDKYDNSNEYYGGDYFGIYEDFQYFIAGCI